MYKWLVLHTTTTHAGKIRYLSKGGKNSESERHTGCCFVLLAFQASRLKKRGSWDSWLYKQRVVSDR